MPIECDCRKKEHIGKMSHSRPSIVVDGFLRDEADERVGGKSMAHHSFHERLTILIPLVDYFKCALDYLLS